MIEQGTPEWFLERLGFATASRAQDVLAKGKDGEAVTRRNLRVELACERITGKPTDDGFTNKHLVRGNELEAYAGTAYCDRTGYLAAAIGFQKHPTIEWVGASPDLDAGEGGVEIKCPIAALHVETLLGGMPVKHRKQIQWQLWVKPKWKWVDFVSYNEDVPDKLQLYVFRVMRDQEYIDKTIEPEALIFLKDTQDTYDKLMELNR